MENGKWELCFASGFIDWDGETLSMKDEGEIRASLEVLVDAGIHWTIVGGVQFVEKANFDLAEGSARFKEIIDEYGIKVSSHHCVQPTWLPVGEDQTPVNDMMRRVIEAASVFEPGSHVVHTGIMMGHVNHGPGMFAPFNEDVAKNGLDKVLETMASNIRQWGEAAREYGTRVSLENLGRFLQTGDLELMPKLVDMIDHPCVGYCIDSGHAHTWGEPVDQWLRIAGKKLFETHLHDNRGLGIILYPDEKNVVSVPAIDEHLPVGFGTISWMDVILALDEIGFAGPVTFETGGWPHEDRAEGLRQAARWWRTCEKMAMKLKENPAG